VQGVAGGLASAYAINYGACAARGVGGTGCVTVSGTCNTDAGSLLVGGVPSGYTIGGSGTCGTAGATFNCTVTHSKATVTGTAKGVCVN
jgi:MSHA pilin protein MshA